jgi:hypothetical protein
MGEALLTLVWRELDEHVFPHPTIPDRNVPIKQALIEEMFGGSEERARSWAGELIEQPLCLDTTTPSLVPFGEILVLGMRKHEIRSRISSTGRYKYVIMFSSKISVDANDVVLHGSGPMRTFVRHVDYVRLVIWILLRSTWSRRLTDEIQVSARLANALKSYVSPEQWTKMFPGLPPESAGQCRGPDDLDRLVASIVDMAVLEAHKRNLPPPPPGKPKVVKLMYQRFRGDRYPLGRGVDHVAFTAAIYILCKGLARTRYPMRPDKPYPTGYIYSMTHALLQYPDTPAPLTCDPGLWGHVRVLAETGRHLVSHMAGHIICSGPSELEHHRPGSPLPPPSLQVLQGKTPECCLGISFLFLIRSPFSPGHSGA